MYPVVVVVVVVGQYIHLQQEVVVEVVVEVEDVTVRFTWERFTGVRL